MENLDTFYGNPVSVQAERHLNLVGIGSMLGLSHHESMNLLSAMHYRMELGANSVYVLQSKPDEKVSAKLQVPAKRRGYTLFGPEVTYNKLADMLTRGAEIRTTKLTENFGFEDYLNKNRDRAIPLFALTPWNNLRIFTMGKTFTPGSGWTIISMVAVDEGEPQKNAQND